MTDQPDDVFVCFYNDNEFDKLDSKIKNNESDTDSFLQFSFLSPELLDENIAKKSINQDFDSCELPLFSPSCDFSKPLFASSCDFNEPLFPDCQLDDTELMDFPEGANHEVTITTTTSDVNKDSDMNDDILSQLDPEIVANLTPDEIKNIFKEASDQFDLQIIDDSIKERTISIKVQPPADLRPRYKSDGKRQIEKSRSQPMAVKLPNLKGIQLNSDTSFFLRLSLITSSKEESDRVRIHGNKLEYHSADVQELNDGTICVPLNIEDEMKGLPRLSIIRTKLGAYKSELTPYSLSALDIKPETKGEKMSAEKAQKIIKQFKLKASRIACQLMIKKNNSWHFTNIECKTHDIQEKDQKPTGKKSKKRSVDLNDDEEEEEGPSTSKSKPTKRKKVSQ